MKFAKTFSSILVLFLLYTSIAEGMSIPKSVSELRCTCINVAKPNKPIKDMSGVEILPSGPHCKNTEVIVILKNKTRICVDPNTSWLQKIIKTALEGKKKE